MKKFFAQNGRYCTLKNLFRSELQHRLTTIPYPTVHLIPSGYSCFERLWWREEEGRAQYNLHDLLLVNIAGSGRHKTGCGGHHKDGAEAGGNQGSPRPSGYIQEYWQSQRAVQLARIPGAIILVYFFITVVDPGWYPGSRILTDPSRISDTGSLIQQQQQKEEGEKLFSYLFL